jgi:RHS repeat-associated protein
MPRQMRREIGRLNEQLYYLYDAAGNLQYRTNNALIQNFQVNSLNELTSETNGGRLTVVGTTTPIATNVTVNSSNAVIYGDYTFAATNMPLTNTYTALALGGGLAATNAVTFNLASNAVFQYDGNGNLTSDGWRNFVYDDENQLIQVYVPGEWLSQFVYDGKKRRRIRTEFNWQSGGWIQTNQVLYVYDGNLAIQERSSNNAVQVTYTRGRDMSGSLDGAGGISGLLGRTDTNGSTYYHADGNGNVMMLINSTQAVVAKYLYDAFGNVLSASGLLAEANRYQFSSKERDLNSGLVYYLYRFYDPNLQRWLNRDPLGEPGFATLRMQQSLVLAGDTNRYLFLSNDPLSRIDATGLYPYLIVDNTCSCSATIAAAYITLIRKMLALEDQGRLPQAQPFSLALLCFLGANGSLHVSCGGVVTDIGCLLGSGQGWNVGTRTIHLCNRAFNGNHKLGTVIVVEATKTLGCQWAAGGEYPYAEWLDDL